MRVAIAASIRSRQPPADADRGGDCRGPRPQPTGGQRNPAELTEQPPLMRFGVGGHAHVGLQRGGGMSRGLHEVVAIGCSGGGGGSRPPKEWMSPARGRWWSRGSRGEDRGRTSYSKPTATGGGDWDGLGDVRVPVGRESAHQRQHADGDRQRLLGGGVGVCRVPGWSCASATREGSGASPQLSQGMARSCAAIIARPLLGACTPAWWAKRDSVGRAAKEMSARTAKRPRAI